MATERHTDSSGEPLVLPTRIVAAARQLALLASVDPQIRKRLDDTELLLASVCANAGTPSCFSFSVDARIEVLREYETALRMIDDV